MKQFGIAALLALVACLAGCGSGSNSSNSNVNGNWSAALSQPNGTTQMTFTTSLSQNSNNAVTGANLKFSTASPCFDSTATETGSFVLSGNFNGNVGGTLQLTIQSGGSPAGANVLTLNGLLGNSTISGNWTLTGVASGCSGSGTFSMTRQ